MREEETRQSEERERNKPRSSYNTQLLQGMALSVLELTESWCEMRNTESVPCTRNLSRSNVSLFDQRFDTSTNVSISLHSTSGLAPTYLCYMNLPKR